MPRDEVARRSYPPSALPTSNFPYVGAVEVPVPPFTIPRTPTISEARSTSAAVTEPEVALRMPVSDPTVSLCTESPPEKVEVELAPVTFKNPWMVEVPVGLLCKVEVAIPPATLSEEPSVILPSESILLLVLKN